MKGNNMLESTRNFMISDVELNWAKLVSPVDPFQQGARYEMQIATTDATKAQEWKDNYLNVKEKDGVFTVQLKRMAERKDGSDNGKVRVVDANRAPFENVGSIGNGSRGNVIVSQFPYSYAGRKGVGTSLEAVQVTDYQEYTPENAMDFDIVGAPASDDQMF